jgi:hypothetical protein
MTRSPITPPKRIVPIAIGQLLHVTDSGSQRAHLARVRSEGFDVLPRAYGFSANCSLEKREKLARKTKTGSGAKYCSTGEFH